MRFIFTLHFFLYLLLFQCFNTTLCTFNVIHPTISCKIIPLHKQMKYFVPVMLLSYLRKKALSKYIFKLFIKNCQSKQ